MMRVIAGKYKRRILSWPDDVNNIRPTKDRIREAIFSALGDIENFTVLDLYSGSGAMGIEALSRNAKSCYFVDNNSIALKTTKDNLNSLRIPSCEGIVIGCSDKEAIGKLKLENIKFDLVILDPPYEKGEYESIVNLLKEEDLLSKNAIIVCESNRKILLNHEEYKTVREYKYGEILVTIFWR